MTEINYCTCEGLPLYGYSTCADCGCETRHEQCETRWSFCTDCGERVEGCVCILTFTGVAEPVDLW